MTKTGWWACSVCRQRSDDFEPARGPGNRRGASFVVALPCGHQNPDGLTWHETTKRPTPEPSTSCEDLCMEECIGACGVLPLGEPTP